jgi:hypothetical protein
MAPAHNCGSFQPPRADGCGQQGALHACHAWLRPAPMLPAGSCSLYVNKPMKQSYSYPFASSRLLCAVPVCRLRGTACVLSPAWWPMC